MAIQTSAEAMSFLRLSWRTIRDEARAVLGGELHYQAVVYYSLRLAGVPASQLGMNVKMHIEQPISPLFQSLQARKHPEYRDGFEPIPDVVLFAPEVNADWRRRNHKATLTHMLLAIEVKASERAGARLGAAEVIRDIMKLAAHLHEVRHRGGDMLPVMIVIDTAPLANERMAPSVIEACRTAAREHAVAFFYVSPDREIIDAEQTIAGSQLNIAAPAL